MVLVSNGPGEDWIGAKLGLALTHLGVRVTPVPLVGPGHHYQAMGLDPVGGHSFFKSGGFYRSWASVWGDLKAGAMGTIWRQYRQLRDLTRSVTAMIAVGDVACLAMVRHHRHPVFFLPTAKSDRMAPHWPLEYALIKRWARGVFPRDPETTASFRAHHIPAWYEGNIMMDGLVPDEALPPLSPSRRVVVLPGSRAESAANLGRVMAALSETPSLALVIEIPPSMDPAPLYQILRDAQMIETPDGFGCPRRSWTLRFSTTFPSATLAAQVVIGMAGTANEQAAYLHKPVLTLTGTGPQTTPRRMTEQARLMPGIHYVGDPSPAMFRDHLEQALAVSPRPLPAPQSAAPLVAARIIENTLSCVS